MGWRVGKGWLSLRPNQIRGPRGLGQGEEVRPPPVFAMKIPPSPPRYWSSTATIAARTEGGEAGLSGFTGERARGGGQGSAQRRGPWD